jgi:hypothetical protein
MGGGGETAARLCSTSTAPNHLPNKILLYLILCNMFVRLIYQSFLIFGLPLADLCRVDLGMTNYEMGFPPFSSSIATLPL